MDIAVQEAQAIRPLSEEDQKHCTPVSEISGKAFEDALHVLPPMGWHCAKYTESFKLCEFYSGEVTSIYVRVGLGIPRYFTFKDCYRLSHAAILAKVQAFIGVKQDSGVAADISEVAVVDPGLIAGGLAYQRLTAWVSRVCTYRPVNGSKLSMINAELLPWEAIDGSEVGQALATELIALDPQYLIAGEESLSVPSMTGMLQVDLRGELQDYDDPRETIEWRWVEAHACMAHIENGSSHGVWDLVVKVDSTIGGGTVPTVIHEQLLRAQSVGAAYVLFHQGT